MYSRNMKKIQLQNILALRLKPNLAITFWAIPLVVNFEDFILIFYIWAPNTTIKVIMKKIQIK